MAQLGDQIWFLGLQGSCRRGEETPQSDIDMVVIFQCISRKVLSAYREIIQEMPYSEKACGFVSGKAELLAWPGSDLFSFYYDTPVSYTHLDVYKRQC